MPDSPAENDSDGEIGEANQNITEEYSAGDVVGLCRSCDGEAVLLWIPPNECSTEQQDEDVEDQRADQETFHVVKPPGDNLRESGLGTLACTDGPVLSNLFPSRRQSGNGYRFEARGRLNRKSYCPKVPSYHCPRTDSLNDVSESREPRIQPLADLQSVSKQERTE